MTHSHAPSLDLPTLPHLSMPSVSFPISPPCLYINIICKANLTHPNTGIDFVQEKFLKQGPQDNESAVEQAKDEQISDFIRDKYKTATGSEMPIKDKETRLG
jgi:hypothetical protein